VFAATEGAYFFTQGHWLLYFPGAWKAHLAAQAPSFRAFNCGVGALSRRDMGYSKPGGIVRGLGGALKKAATYKALIFLLRDPRGRVRKSRGGVGSSPPESNRLSAR